LCPRAYLSTPLSHETYATWRVNLPAFVTTRIRDNLDAQVARKIETDVSRSLSKLDSADPRSRKQFNSLLRRVNWSRKPELLTMVAAAAHNTTAPNEPPQTFNRDVL